MGNQRINYLSLASVVSAYAVVTMHINTVFWAVSTERYWISANIIDSVFYFAVPIFFMISGATLIDYRERYSTREFFKKRITKTLIPFLIWSLIGVVFIRLKNGMFPIPTGILEWKEVILSVLNNNCVGVYWFFTPLFCVYLCIPLFSAVQKDIRMKVFQYLIGAALIFNITLPFLTSVLPIGYENALQVDVVSGYLFYTLVGYVLNKQSIEKKWRILSYVLGLIGLLIQIIGTYVTSVEVGFVVMLYKGYTNLPCVLYSIAVFIFIKEISSNIKKETIWRFVNWVGKYTFAIYLMHWYVLVVVEKVLRLDPYSIVYRLGGAVLICGLCILITWFIRKIPVIKKIVP